MTRQIQDVLWHQGREYPMQALPLEDYYEQTGVPRPFKTAMTCMQRGYVAEWLLSGNRLLLISLLGELNDGRQASVASIFPQAWASWVFADWYSGIINAGYGRSVSDHPLMPAMHESTWSIQCENGRLVGQWQTHRDLGAGSA